MKADIKEIDNRVTCHGNAYSLHVCLVSEGEAEAMRLGILSQTLRQVGVWCIIDPENGRLEIRAAEVAREVLDIKEEDDGGT